eukprot:8072045-Ditylum_brightwellii.AAC.1
MLGGNQVAETIFHHGSSTNKFLHIEVLRLRKLEVKNSCRIHLVHCAGTHMIAQGTDGVSQGNMTEGVMRGVNMMQFIPLHRIALEKNPSIREWMHSWAPWKTEFLKLEDWFEKGHDITRGAMNNSGLWCPHLVQGVYVWELVPAAAAVAIEELQQAQHKQLASAHIILIPHLMDLYWQWALYKAANFLTQIPVGQSFWPSHCHEPLLLAICLPFITYRPWQLRQSPALLGMKRILQHMLKMHDGTKRNILCKLWVFKK